MKEGISRALIVTALLAAFAGPARAGEKLWLHVTVDESDGAKVTVNLPLALAEKALPMLPIHEEMHWGDHHGLKMEDLRELWAEVRDSPDMTFVTVEEDDENVRVWKEKNFVYVEVRELDGGEKVDVRVPMAVVDALMSGEEIDFEAAVQALAKSGGGDLVTVKDDEDNVRVWIDETPESRPTAGR